jgi:hypothetical protein
MRVIGGGWVRIPVLFLIALAASPGGANDRLPPLDLTGLYATTHPRESWGDVLVQFRPSRSVLTYKGADYAAYEVSLWTRREDSGRKLRDGLFGTYTLAAVVPDRRATVLLWYSPDERRFKYNRILRVGSDRSIWLGARDPSKDRGPEPRVLQHLEDSLLPAAGPLEDPDLEGVYDYYHNSTGRVLVGFRKAGGSADGLQQYSVSVLSEIKGLGYAVVRQGLYGGSLANDSYPRVELQTLDGERWLVWSNPAKPGRLRKNRIVCYYPNGDIAIGLDQGEAKYVENTVFRRICGPEARIGRYGDFITLEGLYGIKLRGCASEVIAAILPTNLFSDTGEERIRIFKIRSAGHDGLRPGDPFCHLGLRSEQGRCILAWYSFALQIKEQLLLYDLDSGGNFKLGSLRTDDRGEGSALLEFRKIAPLPGWE